MKLSCAMVAGLNSKEQILNVIKSANSLAKNELEWYICPDPYVNLDYFDFLKEEKTFVKLLLRSNPLVNGGANIHGNGLDIIIQNVENKYIMICDTDIIITLKDWDNYMLNYLDDTHISIGSECWGQKMNKRFPKMAHFHNHKDWPIMGPILIVNKLKHLETHTSFIKTKINNKEVLINKPDYINMQSWINGGRVNLTNNFMKDIFNKKATSFNMQGGWRVPLSYNLKGYKGITLPTDGPENPIDKKQYWQQILTKDETKIIVLHTRGGGGSNKSSKTHHGFNNSAEKIYNLLIDVATDIIFKQNNIKINFIKI